MLATPPRDQWLPFLLLLWGRCRRAVLRLKMTDQGQVLCRAKWGNGVILKTHSRIQLVDILGVTSTDKNHYLPWRTTVRKRIIKEVHMSCTGTFHCHEISVSSSRSQGLFILFKRIVSQNREAAEGKKNYRYNQLSLLQLLVFTRLNKVLNVKGSRKTELRKSFHLRLRRDEGFSAEFLELGCPIRLHSPKAAQLPIPSSALRPHWRISTVWQVINLPQRAGLTQRCPAKMSTKGRDADSMQHNEEDKQHTQCVWPELWWACYSTETKGRHV